VLFKSLFEPEQSPTWTRTCLVELKIKSLQLMEILSGLKLVLTGLEGFAVEA
jgi:hypothetical protein